VFAVANTYVERNDNVYRIRRSAAVPEPGQSHRMFARRTGLNGLRRCANGV